MTGNDEHLEIPPHCVRIRVVAVLRDSHLESMRKKRRGQPALGTYRGAVASELEPRVCRLCAEWFLGSLRNLLRIQGKTRAARRAVYNLVSADCDAGGSEFWH